MADVHFFDVNIAQRYGVNCAVILQNLWHWIRKNEANGTHYHDGKYWTYNSNKAFCEMFSYLTQRQIETALKKLREEGIVETGNYNEVKYDRTLWYAITEKGLCILQGREYHPASDADAFHTQGNSISHPCEMDSTPEGNRFRIDVKPIPDINTDRNTDNYDHCDLDKKNDDLTPAADCQQVVDLYNSTCHSLPKVRSLTDPRRKAIQALLQTYTLEDFKTVFDKAEASWYFKGNNSQGWMANFDWLLKSNKFPLVLEGRYDDRLRRSSQQSNFSGQRQLDDDERAAIARMMEEPDCGGDAW